jgi:hypothetical protein
LKEFSGELPQGKRFFEVLQMKGNEIIYNFEKWKNFSVSDGGSRFLKRFFRN